MPGLRVREYKMKNLEHIKIVFLICAGRAGSGFLHSLLDSHPQVLTLPMELKYYDCWLRLNAEHISDPDEMVKVWCEQTKLAKLGTGIHYGFEESKNSYTNCDFPVFKAKFKSYLLKYGMDRRNVFYAMHHAYADSIEQSMDNVKVILEFSASPRIIDHAQDDFNGVKFLHVVRDFRANYASMKQYFLATRKGLIAFSAPKLKEKILVTSILDTLLGVRKILKLEANSRFDVRLEDLHLNLNSTMTGVADWLGIDARESLFVSTLGGQPWMGNSSSGKAVSGVNPEVLTRWKNNLNSAEVVMVNYWFRQEMQFFDFEDSENVENINARDYIVNVCKPFKNELKFPSVRDSFNDAESVSMSDTFKRYIKEALRFGGRIVFYPITRLYLIGMRGKV